VYCKNCKKEISHNDNFCTNCGCSIQDFKNSNWKNKKDKFFSSTWALALFRSIVLFIMMYSLYSGDGDSFQPIWLLVACVLAFLFSFERLTKYLLADALSIVFYFVLHYIYTVPFISEGEWGRVFFLFSGFISMSVLLVSVFFFICFDCIYYLIAKALRKKREKQF